MNGTNIHEGKLEHCSGKFDNSCLCFVMGDAMNDWPRDMRCDELRYVI